MPNRDNFARAVQTDLALRAGLGCSNPECRVLTKGPGDRSSDVASVGVAGHIKAAAPGGPRFDSSQSEAERSSIDNGIWLCANCSRRIDIEPATYTVEILRRWKEDQEDEVRQALGRLPWNRFDAHVLVRVDLHQPDQGSWRNGPDAIVVYETERRDDVLVVRATLPYLTRFMAGDVIRPLSYAAPNHGPFLWSFPTLDIKVLNNTSRTVFLTDLVLNVSSSRPAPIRLLVIRDDTQGRWGGQIRIVNEGSSKVTDLSLTLRLLPPGALDDATAPTAHKVPVGDVESDVMVPLWDAIKAAGVDLGGLEQLAAGVTSDDRTITVKTGDGADLALSPDQLDERQRACLGPFVDGRGTIVGTLDFSAPSEDGRSGRHSVRFEAPLCLFDENRTGVARPITFEYSAALKYDGTSYTVSRSISQEMKAGETDRFSVELAASRSAHHFLTLSLTDVSGQVVAKQKIELMMLVPLSHAGAIAHRLGEA